MCEMRETANFKDHMGVLKQNSCIFYLLIIITIKYFDNSISIEKREVFNHNSLIKHVCERFAGLLWAVEYNDKFEIELDNNHSSNELFGFILLKYVMTIFKLKLRFDIVWYLCGSAIP